MAYQVYDFSEAWGVLTPTTKKKTTTKRNSTPNFRQIDQQTIKDAEKAKLALANINPEFAGKHPRITNIMETVTSPIKNFMSGNAERLAEKTADTLLMTDRSSFGVPYTHASSPRAQKATDVGGAILGSLIPYGGIYKGLDAAAIMSPRLSRLSPLTQTGVKGAIAGGTYEGAVGLLHEESPEEIAKRVGLGAGLGALGDAALVHGLPALRRFNQTDTSLINNLDFTKPLLSLPSPVPQQRLTSGIRGYLPGDVVIPQPGQVGSTSLPMGQAERDLKNSFRTPLLTGDIDSSIRQRGVQHQALPMSGEEQINRQYAEQAGLQWPLDTQGKAQVDFYRTINGIKPSIEQRPLVKKQQTANKWGLAKEEAAKRGIDLEDLYRTATDPETARWKDVVGLGQDAPREPYTPVMSTPEELNNARTILKKTKNVDRARVILEAYPELKPEFKNWQKRIEIAQKARQRSNVKPQKTVISETFEARTPGELSAARSVLKSVTNPDKAEKILEAYPELGKEFRDKIKKLREQTPAEELRQVKPETQTEVKPETEIKTEPVQIQKIDEVINSVDATKLKDTTGFKASTMDVYRIFRDVFGKHFPKVKKAILDPFDDAKKRNVQFQQDLLTGLKTEVVDKLGIKKGSKESALVQQYGEKQITLEELKRRSPKKWKDIVEADKWFRQKYDELLDQVNAVRQQIYPNDPEKIIPKRKDYYRHFRDISENIRGIHNIFDSTANIDPRLAGISDFTKPNTKWASFAQRRLGGRFTNDAVDGFLDYAPAASYAIHIDPQIPVFRALRNALANQTLDSKNLNKFLEYLNDYANDLAGKTNPFDRNIQKVIPGGRKTFQVINWLNNRVKSNMILGNVGSALSQIANVPAGVAFAKQHAIKGAGKTMLSIFKPNKDIAKSGFIQERYDGYGSKLYRQFNESLLSKPRDFAVWMLESTDKIGTSFIWNSAHAKAVAEGIKNPIKYADDVTRSLVAGRGIGEVPLAQKARLFQMVAPFQVEVANLWHVQRDFLKRKDLSALVMLYLANYIFNQAMEHTRGSGVVFDPINALIDAAEEDLTLLERGGRIAGEVISNVPLGQSLTATLYPEYGFDFYGHEMPTRRELFGENDPTRFGSGVILAKGLQTPTSMLLAPFGGKQATKTWEGIKAIDKGGVYTQDGKKLKYPIDQNAVNELKGLLFGSGAFNEARDYYDNDNRPLTEKQTKEVNKSKDRIKAYQNMQKQRDIKHEISVTKESKELTKAEKEKKINQLKAELNKLNGGK